MNVCWLFLNFDFNNDNKKFFVILLGIFDEFDIKVIFWEMDLGIFLLLFSKKFLVNKDFFILFLLIMWLIWLR